MFCCVCEDPSGSIWDIPLLDGGPPTRREFKEIPFAVAEEERGSEEEDDEDGAVEERSFALLPPA